MPILGTLLLSTSLGCSSRTDFVSPVYDACFTINDCVETATLCEELSVDFGGFTYTNAICTLTCGAQGAVSPDCPRAFIGWAGSCYPSSVAGGIDDKLICFEPCVFDEDCQGGFRCLGALSICGTVPAPCPIDENDAICVPGPF